MHAGAQRLIFSHTSYTLSLAISFLDTVQETENHSHKHSNIEAAKFAFSAGQRLPRQLAFW